MGIIASILKDCPAFQFFLYCFSNFNFGLMRFQSTGKNVYFYKTTNIHYGNGQ